MTFPLFLNHSKILYPQNLHLKKTTHLRLQTDWPAKSAVHAYSSTNTQ